MDIAFTKVNKNAFKIEKNNLVFGGFLERIGLKEVICDGYILGNEDHYCDSCGIDLELNINHKFKILLSDGICHRDDFDLFMEFFEGKIDLLEIFNSELESYKSDYFYCDNCKFKQGE